MPQDLTLHIVLVVLALAFLAGFGWTFGAWIASGIIALLKLIFNRGA